MTSSRNVSLRAKLVGLAGVLLALLTVQSVLELSGSPTHGVTLIVLGAGVIVGGGLAAMIVHDLSSSFENVTNRLDAVARATEDHLVPALQAMSTGDLTVELHSGTKAITEFDRDELGQVMRHIEDFRGSVLNCYGPTTRPQPGCAR